MKNAFVIVIALLTIYSCRDKPDQADGGTPAPGDSAVVETIDTALSNETISFFNESGYSDYARTRSQNFDWSRFRLIDTWKDDTLLQTNFKPDKTYLQTYGKYFRYSPDSASFIDLDSYNVVVTKTKDGKLKGHDEGPDTQVSLVDLAGGKKKRLVFLGPGSSIDEGGWLDEDNIVLIGLQDNPAATAKIPMIWKYHIPTSTFYLYESPDTVGMEKQLNKWRKERLKDLNL